MEGLKNPKTVREINEYTSVAIRIRRLLFRFEPKAFAILKNSISPPSETTRNKAAQAQ
jgi:hypothetical protein